MVHGASTAIRTPVWMTMTLLLAAGYNLAWGTWVALFPRAYFDQVGMTVPTYLQLWQCIGITAHRQITRRSCPGFPSVWRSRSPEGSGGLSRCQDSARLSAIEQWRPSRLPRAARAALATITPRPNHASGCA